MRADFFFDAVQMETYPAFNKLFRRHKIKEKHFFLY